MTNIPSANHRRAERETTTLPISLVFHEGRQASYEASMVDLSLGGASIQTHHELVPGEWVGIMPKSEFPYAIPSRVVWVRPKDAAGVTYVAGLEFINTLPV